MKRYEYSLLRYCHSPKSGEIVNVGLILFIPDERALVGFITPRYARLKHVFPSLDGQKYRAIAHMTQNQINDLARRVRGGEQLELGAPTASDSLEPTTLMPLLELTLRNAAIRWSEVRGGLHADPLERYEELKRELVTGDEDTGDGRRSKVDVGRSVRAYVQNLPIVEDKLLFEVKFRRGDLSHEFQLGWVNGTQQFADSISFDYADRSSVWSTANQICGLLHNLDPEAKAFRFTAIVAPSSLHPDEYESAVRLVNNMKHTRAIVEEDHLDTLRQQFAQDGILRS